ncbi:undecaprenyl-phosphate galactose phosphotransferase WbaP [Planctomicrobium sp. SH527]|uniref:undecaprenyl-phosphate galactose phosphotransferase WbaP n=1 Tax=Planctomicrobium sp. SH527 TaxID=3448123 RepID=UPI003F5C17E7
MTTLPAKRAVRLDAHLSGEEAAVQVSDVPGSVVKTETQRKQVVSVPIGPHVRPGSYAETSSVSVLGSFFQNLRTGIPLLLMDVIGLALGLVAAGVCAAAIGRLPLLHLHDHPELFLNVVIFVVVYSIFGLYPGVGINPVVELKQMILGTLAGGFILLASAFMFGSPKFSDVAFILSMTAFSVFFAPLLRCTSREILAGYSWWAQPALVIGSGESAVRLLAAMRRKCGSGLNPIGMVSEQHCLPDDPSGEFLGSLSEIAEIARENKVHWALIPMDDGIQEETLPRILPYCASIPNLIVVPACQGFPNLWSRTRDLGGVLGLHVRERLLSPTSQFCKRVFDLVAVSIGGLILMIGLIPVMICAWICLKRHSPGPMFYSQERIGKGGEKFRVWKFRTMVLDAERKLEEYLEQHPEFLPEWEVNQKLQDDPRIIPGIGNFLRKSSLDEIPQLWNVFKGEMSLVGPRPFMEDQSDFYGDVLPLYMKVRPGITGMWQISGRNHTTFEERVAYDAYYVRNWSLWLDIFILGRTIRTVLFREGAF